MNQLLDRIVNTPERSPAPLLLVRGVVGLVFVPEGILNFGSPAQQQLRGMTLGPE